MGETFTPKANCYRASFADCDSFGIQSGMATAKKPCLSKISYRLYKTALSLAYESYLALLPYTEPSLSTHTC